MVDISIIHWLIGWLIVYIPVAKEMMPAGASSGNWKPQEGRRAFFGNDAIVNAMGLLAIFGHWLVFTGEFWRPGIGSASPWNAQKTLYEPYNYSL